MSVNESPSEYKPPTAQELANAKAAEMITNPDGTVSIVDSPNYSKQGA